MSDQPRYEKVWCSQCGSEFGPRDSGYSHCSDHKGKHPYPETVVTQYDKLKDLAQMIVDRWGEDFDNEDEEISGCDAVDSLGNYVELAQDALSTKEKPVKPSYKELVAVLGMAVAEWAYLFPEKFDDDVHQAESRQNLKRAERIYKQALRALLDASRKKGRR